MISIRAIALASAGLSAAVVLSGAAAAQTPAPAHLGVHEAALRFGARESVLQASLSPDGKKLAMLEPVGPRGAMVRILDLTDASSKPSPILQTTGDPDRIQWCRWAGTTRLMCQAFASMRLETGDITYISRLLAIDANGKNMQMLNVPRRTGELLGYSTFGGSVLDWNTGKDGHVLMVREYIPESTTGARTAQTEDGLAVDDVDSANLHSASVERARRTALEYVSDGVGHVRILGTDPEMRNGAVLSGKVAYRYRLKDSDEWRPLAAYDQRTNEGFNPYFVDPVLDVVYGLKKQGGRLAALSVALDGSARETTLLSHPTVDVDGFATIGRNRRVVGVTYSTDRRQVDYFDPDLKRLAAGLGRGLHDLPLIRFVDSSQDEKKLLIWAGADTDPGHYYLLDRDTRALTELTLSRAELQGVKLAPVRAIQVPTADGKMMPAYLTLPAGAEARNLPAIVMPHGGPGARDEWGFDWLAQFFAQIGYAVIQPNFRGSAGYGDAWFMDNGFKSWRTAISDVATSGRWLVAQGIADPARLGIFGWSYGGYAALQSAAVDPDLFRAVIAVAPVTDLARLKDEWAHFTISRLQENVIGSGPHIVEGSPARQAAKIKAPVLLFHGTLDRNVGYGQSRLMADQLHEAGKDARLVTYDKLDHYLEDSSVRQDMLEQSAKFLEAAFARK
ncbi:S9 family peptidase [Sphingomonas sp. XMGL2]|uniref:S9 family peptidase n=2 Tax=Sphingomonas quercus TaxID=2842451 RepID=A0ABS6BEN7_9SPHN|nr:S9 family peptidase [Sphingomonas quercus]